MRSSATKTIGETVRGQLLNIVFLYYKRQSNPKVSQGYLRFPKARLPKIP